MKLSWARRDVLIALLAHGELQEQDVTNRSISTSLAKDGLITRTSGKVGSPTTFTITDKGKAELRPDDTCACRRCRR